MGRKREQPAYYHGNDSMKLAQEIEDEISGHDFDDWPGTIIFYNGEMRLIVEALRAVPISPKSK